MKSDGIELHTSLDLSGAARSINASFARMKAHSVEPVEQSNNPLDNIGQVQPDVAVVGMRAGKLNMWAIHVYIYAVDDGCLIELVAIGDGGFTRAMAGTRNSFSLSKSRAQVQTMLADLQAADRSLQILGTEPPPPPAPTPTYAPTTAPPPAPTTTYAGQPRPADPYTAPQAPFDPYATTSSPPQVAPAPVAAAPSGPVGVVRTLTGCPTTLVRGANWQLPASVASPLRIDATWQAPAGSGLDISVLALDESQRAASEPHFVFYGNPRSPEGALAVRSGGAGSASIDLSLTQLPTWVNKMIVIASVDPAGSAITFSAVQHLIATLHDGSNATPLAGCDCAAGASTETAMILCELYQRNGSWRFRAVGQGFFDGLAGVIRTFGLQTS